MMWSSGSPKVNREQDTKKGLAKSARPLFITLLMNRGATDDMAYGSRVSLRAAAEPNQPDDRRYADGLDTAASSATPTDTATASGAAALIV